MGDQMATYRSNGIERSTVLLGASVTGLIVVAGVFGSSGWAMRTLRTIVLDGPLESALLLSWIVLVLLRNPFPGLASGTGLLSRSARRRELVVLLRGLTLLLVIIMLGTGLGFGPVVDPVPGSNYLLVAAVALGSVTMIARGRAVADVSRVELILAVPFTFGILGLLLASGGPGMTTLDRVMTGAGAAAVAVGVALAIGAPVRPPAPFNDPLKLVLGGTAIVAAGSLPDLSLRLNVALALLIMPTIVAVVDLTALTRSGTIGGRSRGLPALEILEEPSDPVERDVRRIKGTFRRIRTREILESGSTPAPEMMAHELTEHLKAQLQLQVGSQARGGEDLPDLLDGEVEVARITYTQTVHGEVVSLRAIRSGDDRLALRLVDEYETEFTLPFDEVSDTITADQVVTLFRSAEPSPTEVAAFSVLSDVIPDLATAFGRAFERRDVTASPRGIGASIRGYFAMGISGAVAVFRMSLDFRGFAVSYEARFFAFGVALARGLVNALTPELSPVLWALWIPVPALVVRRIRTVGLETLRKDAPRLALAVVGVSVLGMVVFELPLLLGAVAVGPSVLMVYLAFRQGPTEHAILRSGWDPRH